MVLLQGIQTSEINQVFDNIHVPILTSHMKGIFAILIAVLDIAFAFINQAFHHSQMALLTSLEQGRRTSAVSFIDPAFLLHKSHSSPNLFFFRVRLLLLLLLSFSTIEEKGHYIRASFPTRNVQQRSSITVDFLQIDIRILRTHGLHPRKIVAINTFHEFFGEQTLGLFFLCWLLLRRFSYTIIRHGSLSKKYYSLLSELRDDDRW